MMNGLSFMFEKLAQGIGALANTRMQMQASASNTVSNVVENMQTGFDWEKLIPDFEYLKTISYNDVIDIIIVAFVLYHVIRLLRDMSGERLVKGVLVLVLILFLASSLKLVMISYFLQFALGYGLLAIAIIFQPELRRLLERLGKGNMSKLFIGTAAPNAINSAIDATVASCVDMAKTKTGALIVFERIEQLGNIIKTGTKMDAEPSMELIKNVFYPNTPLHDGAMVMRGGRVYAAGCVLPLSGSQTISRDLGTRHRAAIGMSESSDSVIVVVSEETGSISVAIDGMLKRSLSGDLLHKILTTELLEGKNDEKKHTSFLGGFRKGDKK